MANGTVLAVFTFGLVLVLRATGILNLAYGEIAALTAMVAAVYLVPRGWPTALVLLAMMAVGTVLGVVTEQVVARPLRDAPVWTTVLATLAMGLLMRGTAGLIWSYTPRPFPYAMGHAIYRFGSYSITRQQLVMVAAAVVVLLGAGAFLKFTRAGVVIRAVAANRVGAEICGVRSRRARTAVWAAGGAIAGLAGFLIAPISFVAPDMMQRYMFLALAAAVVFGLESLWGAVLGGLLVGALQEIASRYVPVSFRELLPVTVIMVALLVRPGGLARQEVARAV
jgi:branched-chain amino acid transport system permease protein